MARVSKPTKFGLKINVMIGWILCTPGLSDWSRLWPCLSFPLPRTRPYMMPLFRRSEEFRWFWRIIPSFLDSSHFSSVCSDLGRGNRESGKSEIIIQRNSEINEAYKQFHFRKATSNRRIGSLLWHLGDNKRSKQPKKLPPIPFFFFFCESSIKYDSEIIILTGSPHQVGKSGKSRKFCDGSGSRTRENEVLKNFMFLRPKIHKLPRPNR